MSYNFKVNNLYLLDSDYNKSDIEMPDFYINILDLDTYSISNGIYRSTYMSLDKRLPKQGCRDQCCLNKVCIRITAPPCLIFRRIYDKFDFIREMKLSKFKKIGIYEGFIFKRKEKSLFIDNYIDKIHKLNEPDKTFQIYL